MSQINCGSLEATGDKEVAFTGDIALGGVVGSLKLTPSTREGRGDDAPDYDVTFKPKNGDAYVAGAAWTKNTARVGDFLTLTIDNPFWDKAVYVTAFPTETRGEFRIVWSRPRRQQEAA